MYGTSLPFQTKGWCWYCNETFNFADYATWNGGTMDWKCRRWKWSWAF